MVIAPAASDAAANSAANLRVEDMVTSPVSSLGLVAASDNVVLRPVGLSRALQGRERPKTRKSGISRGVRSTGRLEQYGVESFSPRTGAPRHAGGNSRPAARRPAVRPATGDRVLR